MENAGTFQPVLLCSLPAAPEPKVDEVFFAEQIFRRKSSSRQKNWREQGQPFGLELGCAQSVFNCLHGEDPLVRRCCKVQMRWNNPKKKMRKETISISSWKWSELSDGSSQQLANKGLSQSPESVTRKPGKRNKTELQLESNFYLQACSDHRRAKHVYIHEACSIGGRVWPGASTRVHSDEPGQPEAGSRLLVSVPVQTKQRPVPNLLRIHRRIFLHH